MTHRSKYSPQGRERAVRMLFEHRDEYASSWEAICSIGEKLGSGDVTC